MTFHHLLFSYLVPGWLIVGGLLLLRRMFIDGSPFDGDHT
jgi:hypothetical protein